MFGAAAMMTHYSRAHACARNGVPTSARTYELVFVRVHGRFSTERHELHTLPVDDEAKQGVLLGQHVAEVRSDRREAAAACRRLRSEPATVPVLAA